MTSFSFLQEVAEIFNGFLTSESSSGTPLDSSLVELEFHGNVFAVPNTIKTKAPHIYVTAKIKNTIRHCPNVF